MKYRTIKLTDEIILLTEEGGVACIRYADPIFAPGEDEIPRVATTDYYQSRIDLCNIPEDIFVELAEGKMYYNDWTLEHCANYQDPCLVTEALKWLGADEGEYDETILPNVVIA